MNTGLMKKIDDAPADPAPRRGFGGPRRSAPKRDFRQLIAQAVWNDLRTFNRLRPAADGSGYIFRYSGRNYALSRKTTAAGRPSRTWAVTLTDSSSAKPFTGTAEWTGGSRAAAVRAMVVGVHGYRCPHGSITGQDSCYGCDAHTDYLS